MLSRFDPKKIEGLMERIDAELAGVELPDRRGKMLREAQDALRTLAQENERLLQSLNISHELELRERIRELEAELAEFTKLKEYAKSLGQQTFLEIHAENERLKTERDAIRAKTIEECAQVIQEDFDRPDMAEAIRALAHASTPFDKSSGAQQDESKTESGE